MNELVYQSIIASLLASDTQGALNLLQDNRSLFFDPIEGILLHARVLYCAIAQANQEVIRFLVSLPILSDIVFFKFCGHTPLSFAIEENNKVVLPLLLQKMDKNFALHMAIKLNFNKTRDFLLKHCHFKVKLLRFLGLNRS
jgi:Ankyrin repeats (3 copies)